MVEHIDGPLFVHDFSDLGVPDGPEPSVRHVTLSCDHPASIEVAAMGCGLTGTVEEARANARRLATVWNACRDLPTEVLESIGDLDGTAKRLRRLLAALEAAPIPSSQTGESTTTLRWTPVAVALPAAAVRDECLVRSVPVLALVGGQVFTARYRPEHTYQVHDEDRGWYDRTVPAMWRVYDLDEAWWRTVTTVTHWVEWPKVAEASEDRDAQPQGA